VAALESKFSEEKAALAARAGKAQQELKREAGEAALAARAAEDRLSTEVAAKERQRLAAAGELAETQRVLESLQKVDLPMWRDRATEASKRLRLQQSDLAAQNARISELVSAANGALSGPERDSLDAVVKVTAGGVTLNDVIKIAESSLIGQRALANAEGLPPAPPERNQ
jgi:hypothetical protein